MSWRSYLEKLAIHDKYINKRAELFKHQTMCLQNKGIKRKMFLDDSVRFSPLQVHTE